MKNVARRLRRDRWTVHRRIVGVSFGCRRRPATRLPVNGYRRLRDDRADGSGRRIREARGERADRVDAGAVLDKLLNRKRACQRRAVAGFASSRAVPLTGTLRLPLAAPWPRSEISFC